MGISAFDDEVLVDRDPRAGEGVSVSGCTQARGFQVVPAAEMADARVAETQQVFGRAESAPPVVDIDDGALGRAGVRIDRHDGHVEFGEHDGGGDDDRAVDERAAQVGE